MTEEGSLSSAGYRSETQLPSLKRSKYGSREADIERGLESEYCDERCDSS